jgi:hypothetical protein
MGRYIWYAEGAANRAFRDKVLKYVAADGDISVLGNGKRSKKPGGGPYQPDPQKKAKVEKSAIELATQHFESFDYVVDSVQRDNLGWDLNAVHKQTGLGLKLEVKGLSGQEISIEMTPNEYKMMRKHQQTYRTCVATNCLKKSQRTLAVFAYNAASDNWVDGSDRPLQINELKSARLRLLNG